VSVTTTTRLVCPGCKQDDNLYSVEKTTILYPVLMAFDADGNPDPQYTGEDRIVEDEGTVFDDTIYCRNCCDEMTTSELLPIVGVCDYCAVELIRGPLTLESLFDGPVCPDSRLGSHGLSS
jgi:ribosomal protein L31